MVLPDVRLGPADEIGIFPTPDSNPLDTAARGRARASSPSVISSIASRARRPIPADTRPPTLGAAAIPSSPMSRSASGGTGRPLAMGKLIPDRGAWMEFETRKSDYLIIKFNRKRTVPVTILLRALAAVNDGMPDELRPVKTGSDEELMALYADIDIDPDRPFIASTIKNEPAWELKKDQTIAQAALK